ncbi:TPA: hypothetical protein I0H43_RS13605 [Enterococcus faecalis]|nr:hypothetical protein [Enterococcus faecalis]
MVLDSCIGSGTTAVAASNTERYFIGFEKFRYYFNVAIDRIKNVKGNVLVKELKITKK